MLLQGRITDWLQSSLGWAVGTMLPSVRCGLEGALLSALADARHLPLHTLLAGCPLPSANSPAGTAVNGLLNCQGNPEERAQEAKHLVSQGYKTLKIKVYMRSLLLSCIKQTAHPEKSHHRIPCMSVTGCMALLAGWRLIMLLAMSSTYSAEAVLHCKP